jgi:2'-5' RNA ligase
LSTKHTNDTKRHETKRLFIAVDISDEARLIASGVIGKLRKDHPAKGVSFTKPENLHITLKFLGSTDASTEARLVETLRRIAADTPPFTLRFDGPELLGKRVMSIRIASDTPTVFDLEKRIDTECRPLGFPSEARRFHPHLTLARIRHPHDALIRRFLQTPIDPVEFPIREIVLYESKLTANGSIYSAIRSFPLTL